MKSEKEMVHALLDIGAEDSLMDQHPGDWTEAGQLQGWGRVNPFSSVFLPQRKRERTKREEPAAPLCEDMCPLGAFNLDRPPDLGSENLQGRGVKSTIPPGLTTEPGDLLTGTSAINCASQDRLLLRDTMPSLPPPLGTQPPALNSQFDPGPAINSFTVLPPLRTPKRRPQREQQQVCFQDSATGGGSAGWISEVGGRVPTIDRTEETGGADVLTSPEPSEDARRAVAPTSAMYSPFQRHYLSTVTVPIVTRYGGPLGTITDTTHRVTSVGRHRTQAVRTGREYTLHERAGQPQLPVLFGTKVPQVVSSQRQL